MPKSSLFSTAQAKKTPTKDIVAALSTLSQILLERDLASDTFDLDQAGQKIVGNDELYAHPESLNSPIAVSQTIVAIPGMKPMTTQRGERYGMSVLGLIELPYTHERYYTFSHDTDTYVSSINVNLRGMRTVDFHRVIPGMIVSLHHRDHSNGGSERVRIDAVRLVYNSKGNLEMERLPESAALFQLPSPRDTRGRGIVL